jgi:hypothetical protein
MPRLIVYVPFTRGEQGDLRKNADELLGAAVPFYVDGIEIDEIVAVFAGEEPKNQIHKGDVLVFHAHGGSDGTALSDNLGEDITMSNALEGLERFGEDAPSAVFFVAGFSAMDGHIASSWKAAHRTVPVYGSAQAVQGALASMTNRGTIRTRIFSKDDRRMQVLP